MDSPLTRPSYDPGNKVHVIGLALLHLAVHVCLQDARKERDDYARYVREFPFNDPRD